jgi:hypothetical protein
MVETTHRRSRHKDMTDLLDLSRAPILSFLRKQVQPPAPRPKPVAAAAAAPTLAERFRRILEYSPRRLLKWIVEYLSHRFGPRHPFKSYPTSGGDNGVYRLEGDDDIRIALAGDWGTGTDEAAAVADLIHAFDPHYAIHLGDVYFVGDLSEVDENFLGIKNPNNDYEPCCWPRGRKGSFALNGNHEMYARGIAYFDRMLPALGLISNGQPSQQKASYFCLENDHWRIVALDTGYNSIGLPLLEYVFQPDCALPPELIHWLRDVVRLKDDTTRGLVILSHHEYYSAFDEWYPKPARQLADFISRPVLWFWGHEHRLTIYDEFGIADGIRAFGRCIGHGGMPVELPPQQAKHSQCSVQFVDHRIYENDEGLTVGYNGFVRMRLKADKLRVEYVDRCNTVLFSETWKTDRGALTRVDFAEGKPQSPPTCS